MKQIEPFLLTVEVEVAPKFFNAIVNIILREENKNFVILQKGFRFSNLDLASAKGRENQQSTQNY